MSELVEMLEGFDPSRDVLDEYVIGAWLDMAKEHCAQVDRLARALAADRMTVHTWKHKSRCWAMCESCRATLAEQNELGADTEAKAKRALEHRPDCVYIEAIDHVEALEGR